MALVRKVFLLETDDAVAAEVAAVVDSTGFILKRVESLAAVDRQADPAAGDVLIASLDGPDPAALLAALSASPLVGRSFALASRPGFALRLAAGRAGVAHLIDKPVDAVRLLTLFERLDRPSAAAPLRVLIVGDDALANNYHAALLQAGGLDAAVADGAEAGLERAAAFDPEVLLVDYYLAECTGPELVLMLRDDERFTQLPVVFLSARDPAALASEVVDKLGEEFLAKPVEPQAFISQVRARARRARRARALVDELRGAQRASRNLRQVLDAHAIVSITDPVGDIIYVNDRFCRTNGYRREELLGRNFSLLRSGVHSEAYYANIWQTVIGGRIWQGELCNRDRRGDFYWVQCTIYPCVDEAGLPYQFVSVSTDVSLRKEVESRLVGLLNTANVGLAWATPEGRLVDCNDTYLAMLGYGRGELLGRNVLDITHPDDVAATRAEADRLLAGARMVRFHKRYVKKDGRLIWADVVLSRLDNHLGEVSGFTCSIIDITSQKVAENRLRLVVRGSLDGIWDWNPRTHAVYYSARFRELLGFGRDEGEAFAAYFHLRRVIHPDDTRRVFAALVAHVRRRGARVFDCELRFLHRNGGYRWFRARGQAVWDERGKVERFAGSFTDFSALKDAEDQLRQAKEAAELASRAKTEFLSRMTHELRTPLNAVLGFAQLLESDPRHPPSPAQRESLGQIQRAGWHLLEVINEVLDLARIEAGGLELAMAEVEVGPLVEESLTLISPLASRHRVTVVNRLGAGRRIVVRADAMRLRQVVLNLLSNAVKYNREGGLAAVAAVEADDAWRLEVADGGIGLRPDQVDALFQPFTRFAADARIEGTGIGLAITKRLVEAMGGRLGVESAAGLGSTFSVTLARADGGAAAPPAGVPLPPPADFVAARPLAVLYIEDDPVSRELMVQILGRCRGVTLACGDNAAQGLALARQTRPDLILLDIDLPDLDGFILKDLLAAETSLADVPVVAVSATHFAGQLERSRQAGFADYLAKPVKVGEVLAWIERLAGGASERG